MAGPHKKSKTSQKAKRRGRSAAPARQPRRGRTRATAQSDEPKGETLELTITALGGRGDAIARRDTGEVVLVPGGVPGDHLRVQLHGRRARVSRGRITTILEASADRITPPCPVAEVCGGCSWQHIAIERQQLEKARNAARAIGQSPQQLGPVAAFGWRRRVRFHLRQEADRLRAGFMAERSDALASTDRCAVLTPPLDTLPSRVAAWLGPCLSRGEGLAHVGAEGVVLRIQGTRRSTMTAALPSIDADAANGLGVIGLELSVDGEVQRWGATEVTLTETAGPHPIRVDAGGFSQASAAANQAIREAVATALQQVGPVDGARELFAGSGNLTGLLLDAAPRVRTVERDAEATARARRCYVDAGDRLTVVTGDASDPGGPPTGKEVWLLDPGRSGAMLTCEGIADHRPAAVIYVSCAADTLRRDLKPLLAVGYKITSSWWVDTFPHTPHLELIVLLTLG